MTQAREEACWKIDANVMYLNEQRNEIEDREVTLFTDLTENHAVQLLQLIQEEAANDDLYERLQGNTPNMTSGSLRNIFNCLHLEDGIKYMQYVEYMKKSREFPRILSTQQVILNFYENFDLETYDPVFGVSPKEVTHNLHKETGRKLFKNLVNLEKPPLQFIAFSEDKYGAVLSMLPKKKLIKGQERMVVNTGMMQAWKVYAVHAYDMTELVHVDGLAQVSQILTNLEKAVLLPELNKDDLHDKMKNNYQYHPKKFAKDVQKIDRTLINAYRCH